MQGWLLFPKTLIAIAARFSREHGLQRLVFTANVCDGKCAARSQEAMGPTMNPVMSCLEAS